MAEVNLLAKLPRGKRNVNARAEAKTEEIIDISRQYGELYFDGPRKYGYGGYRYDGRWVPVAEDMVEALRSQARRPRARRRRRQGISGQGLAQGSAGPRGLRARHFASMR